MAFLQQEPTTFLGWWEEQAKAADGLGGKADPTRPLRGRNRAAELALQSRVKEAEKKVEAETTKPMWQGRGALFGLILLEAVRVAAWVQSEGTSPGFSMVFGMHFLTTVSDIACIVFSMPFFATGPSGSCVKFECFGPMLTLVASMCLVDVCALVAFLIVATPRPVSPGNLRDSQWVRFLDSLEANFGIWEFALVTSVALQMALCVSTWRVYKELRMAGLYPPGHDLDRVKVAQVSVVEVVCEAEDVALLSECRLGGCCQAEPAATVEKASGKEDGPQRHSGSSS